MKPLNSIPFFALGIFALALPNLPVAFAGVGAGGGGDKVEPLFIDAQKKAISIINAVGLQQIDELEIPIFYKNWLKQGDHLVKLQFFTSTMQLEFQEAPCIEDGEPRGTAFDNSTPNQPKMKVSYSYNQNTTPQQAQALVFHEAGHFAGETNHIFLSGLGGELVAHPLNPSSGNVLAQRYKNPDGSVIFTDIFLRVPTSYSSTGFLYLAEQNRGFMDSQGSDFNDIALGLCKNFGFQRLLSARESYVDQYQRAGSLDRSGRLRGLPFASKWIYTSVTCAR